MALAEQEHRRGTYQNIAWSSSGTSVLTLRCISMVPLHHPGFTGAGCHVLGGMVTKKNVLAGGIVDSRETVKGPDPEQRFMAPFIGVKRVAVYAKERRTTEELLVSI